MPENTDPWLHPDDAPKTSYGIEPSSPKNAALQSPMFSPPNLVTPQYSAPYQNSPPDLSRWDGKKKERFDTFALLSVIFFFLFFPIAPFFAIVAIVRINAGETPYKKGDRATAITVLILAGLPTLLLMLGSVIAAFDTSVVGMI